MKKITTILALAIALAISTQVKAAIRRVGFTATNPVAGVDYTTLQAANDAANIGDTIQIYPSINSVDYTATLTKKLVVTGAGYFTYGGFNENQNLQVIKGNASVSVTLDAGATGSIFEGIGMGGLNGNNNYNGSWLSVKCVSYAKVDNIIIRRCYLSDITMANYATNDGWVISQCYSGVIYNTTIDPKNPPVGGAFVKNLRIENCINTTIGFVYNIATGYTGAVNNCSFGDYSNNNLNNAAFLFQNCIFYHMSYGYFSNTTNCVFKNNVTTRSLASSGMNTVGSSNNVFEVNFSATGTTTVANLVYVGYPNETTSTGTYPYSLDSRFQVRAGSVAKTAGIGGIECGAFGGANPYKLSGIPATPAFYKLEAPSATTSTNPYTITFSVRSNN